ncbi:MAG TPA: single-stranded DNA-binding protein [Nitrospirae bacterium]|nr:single-stranded DNA-binding protein [bacterium BMS3Abin06]HDH12701.1 single-stranded DNA-binding protein [Nitrospirota bacterium]HDZ00010.1 single-stranded DNA-binding protein [Nitrospirota bacterium]
MFNKIILIGNLTRDPEMRYTPQGTSVCNFGIAVNRKYKQGEEAKEEVTFINVVVFGKHADVCGQYLNKGRSVLVEGRLQERRWETEDGQKRSKHEVVAQSVLFLSKKQGPADMDSPGGGEAAAPVETTDIEPF